MSCFQTHLSIVRPDARAELGDLFLTGAAGMRVAAAWDAIYSIAKEPVIRRVSQFRGIGIDPEDVWQSTLRRLLKDESDLNVSPFRSLGHDATPAKIITFRGDCRLTTFVTLIAVRIAVDLKRRKRETFLRDESVPATKTEENAVDVAHRSAMKERLKSCIRKAFVSLPESDRQIFALVCIHRLSQRDASDLMNWPDPSKASKRLKVVFEALRTAFVDGGIEVDDLLGPADADTFMKILRQIVQDGHPLPSKSVSQGVATR